ncbi:MAG: type II secretion system inner membrane protein GspF [Brevundimonas sp.]|uniref:type II secretion system inner membrane protein GspF n=1 Tax=Brevundimonas sp. TaxID=1871086 RepID=UPI00391D3600
MSQAFAYLAVDPSGRGVSGEVTAADEVQARRALARKGLTLLELRSGAQGAGEAGPEARGGRPLDTRALAMATRQLATLISVSPLEEALRGLVLQAEKPALKRVLNGVHLGVMEGQRLSDAMGRQGRAFPPLYRAMIAAGEASGALQPILERLAEGLERERMIQGRVLTALIYPAVLAVVALGVIAALMTFVVPKVVEQFDSMNQTLPLLTRIVIGLSDAMRTWGWAGVLALVLAGLASAALLHRPGPRLAFDRGWLRAPVVGRLTRDLHGARMARTLATMLSAGLPVLEGLTLTARTVRNRALQASTQAMADAVREGGGLSAAMKRGGVFPPILMHMTASGEAAGRLAPMLDRAADYLEQEFAAFTTAMLSLLEPAIIVVMGGLVALIVLSILLPILQINTLALG